MPFLFKRRKISKLHGTGCQLPLNVISLQICLHFEIEIFSVDLCQKSSFMLFDLTLQKQHNMRNAKEGALRILSAYMTKGESGTIRPSSPP